MSLRKIGRCSSGLPSLAFAFLLHIVSLRLIFSYMTSVTIYMLMAKSMFQPRILFELLFIPDFTVEAHCHPRIKLNLIISPINGGAHFTTFPRSVGNTTVYEGYDDDNIII